MAEHFVNLTAGLEHLPDIIHSTPYPVQYIRVQSTHSEQGLNECILKDLDNNFLMKLAIGKKCIIYDMTSRKRHHNLSRAIWQGFKWIEYCLMRKWFNVHISLPNGMHKHFSEQYSKLSKPTHRKLAYYRKFLLTDTLKLEYVCEPTDNDGNCELYQKLVRDYAKP